MEDYNPFEGINRKLDALLFEMKRQALPKATGTHQKEWGDVAFASQITGYAPQTIYTKAGRGEIPHIKRDGKLWFEKTALLKWIETGIIDKLENKN
jgi:hypothetical protein